MVVTYDGESDCDEASTVQWSLNGEDQGEMEGVSCSTGTQPKNALAILGLLLGLILIRRR
mgnify:CR=1 FL=1